MLLTLCVFVPMMMSAQQLTRAQISAATSNLGGGAVSIAQASQTAGSSVLSLSTQVQITGAYRQSVVENLQGIESKKVSVEQALTMALRANLGSIAAQALVEQARGGAMAVRSALLPNVQAVLSENVDKVSLASEGFTASSIPSIGQYFPAAIGPFHFYSAQLQAQQSAFDLVAWRNNAAARISLRAARQGALDAREQVALAVAGSYLQVMAAASLVESQQAQVKSAEAVWMQAEARLRAGSVAEIEANRALVELQTERQRLLAVEADLTRQKITLARIVGLPADAEFDAEEKLSAATETMPALEDAYAAIGNRHDLKAAKSQLEAAVLSAKAAHAELLPQATVNANYGLQGVNQNQGAQVLSASASLTIPLFNGRRVRADETQAEASVKERQAELAAATEQARADAHIAWLDLDVARRQVELATANRALAAKNLMQSSDRFAVGASDSVEVVQAEESLAAAEHDAISAAFAVKLAHLNLARAMGVVEKSIPQIFKGNN